MRPDETLRLEIPRSIAQVNNARKDVVAFLASKGISESIVTPIELALFEILVNIVKHASSDFLGSNMIVTCQARTADIELTIEDYGELFDPTIMSLPDIEEHYRQGNKQGLGIFLVRSLMDEVHYHYENTVNKLTLRKRIA